MIDWSYLAGFFDGEGCVYTYNDKVRLDFTQKKNLAVLHEINSFLISNNIVSHFYDGTKRDKASRVRVGGIDDVIACINGMMPYLIVNRDKAVMALKLLSEQQPRKRVSILERKNILDMRDKMGMTAMQIATITGRPFRTIRNLVYRGQGIVGRKIDEHPEWLK